MTGTVVTIVTPSYNQGRFIRATIESVLAQEYPALEYIVMDGGSTDETAAIAAEYASRLTWVSGKDRGQGHAINMGFARAQGPIVAWLNSDDLLLPGAVAHAVAAFAEAPHAGAVYGEGYLIDQDGRITGRFPATEPFNLWKLVHLSDYVLQQSTFFRRTAVDAIGGLDESLHYALDWDLLIRLGQRFGLHYVPIELGMLREHPAAKTWSGGRARVEEIRRVLERHTGLTRAPGYWIYALDTVHRQWKDRLVSVTPRQLRIAAMLGHALVYVPAALAIRHILWHAQGLYPDGWASDRLQWMMPEGGGEVVVRGTLPFDARLRGMVVTATAGGQARGRWGVPPGDFELRFDAPAGAGPFSFELHASRWYRRLRLRQTSIERRAYRLRSIGWAAATPRTDGRLEVG